MNDNLKINDLRGPCDIYCPLISSISCGLPEAGHIYKAAQKGILWACHSNNSVPCVATNFNKFPTDSIVVKDPNKFVEV